MSKKKNAGFSRHSYGGNISVQTGGGSITGNVIGGSDNTINNQNIQINESSAENQQTLAEAAEEMEQILDKIINKNLVAAQQSAQEAVNRLPALTNPELIELTARNNLTLRERFQSAITAMGIETVKVIFAPAGIPIEGIRAWRSLGE